jgi:threonine aldolase
VQPVDLRSDTVTRPTPGMRDAMRDAEVGDDVFGDDPTLIRLEQRIAEITGKEAALYVPSGTMGNQLGIRSQTSHGDEILVDRESHIFNYESAGAAALSGVQPFPLDGPGGRIDAAAVVARATRPTNDHYPKSTLLCLENTHNRAGGRVFSLEELEEPARTAHAHGMLVHLDGARLWNAEAQSGIPIARWASVADTVMMCFSKGLGAPVGSILAGPAETIRRARRLRKMFGGGMRQGGVLAAACLYALDHHRSRLSDDHRRARQLAEALTGVPGVRTDPAGTVTNIVLLHFETPGDDSVQAVARAKELGVWVSPFGPRTVRAVLHLDVDDRALARAIEGLRRAFSARGSIADPRGVC